MALAAGGKRRAPGPGPTAFPAVVAFLWVLRCAEVGLLNRDSRDGFLWKEGPAGHYPYSLL